MQRVAGEALIAPAPAASRVRRTADLRSAASTTPGRIRVLSIAVVASLVLAWAVDLAAIAHRHHAVTAFTSQSEPLVVTAQRIETELDQADASAANAFLAGGIEPADQRAAYEQSIAAAATDLADAARETGSDTAGIDDVRTIATQFGVYAGLVEQARANNRQGFPVGAAYLRDATSLLRTAIVPAAAHLAARNAQRLNEAENGASAPLDVVMITLTALLLLGALFAVQRFLILRTRRAVNVGLGVASLVSLGLVAAVLGVLAAERSAVVSANSHSYAAAAALARARALIFEARADESQALIAQGNGRSYLDDYASATAQVGPLLAKASSAAPTAATADDVAQADQGLALLLAVHKQIVACDAAGQHAAAVAMAVTGSVNKCGPPAATVAVPAGGTVSFDGATRAGIDAAQAAFTDKADAARNDLQRLPLLATVAAIVAGLLALAGAQQRINEYR